MRHLLACLLLVAGCGGASSKVAIAPDGRLAYQVACGDAPECLIEAHRLCPKGYKTFGAGERTTGAVAQSFGNVAYAVPVTSTVMDIRCMEALGEPPTD